MTKRASLDTAAGYAAMTASKPGVAPPPAPEAAGQKTITLRLEPATWRHLRQLAVDRDTSMQALAMEGIGMVFERHGRPRGGAA